SLTYLSDWGAEIISRYDPRADFVPILKTVFNKGEVTRYSKGCLYYELIKRPYEGGQLTMENRSAASNRAGQYITQKWL
ncbi:MAG: hypothetical protein OXM87_08775, partial [Truepera sp.]|nr:hypothetical protein [Truepera sp.]